MSFDDLLPPLLTANLPGIGGRIKEQPEDFEVEEIPAYEPSGTGDYLYLWIEKRDLGAEFFVRLLAQRLHVATGEIGTAGMKDRRAVTRQLVSVPLKTEELLAELDGEGIRVLRVSRHGNKLKPGHLHGNRFNILVRGVDPVAGQRLPPLLEQLRRDGLPNFYGPQRFGRGGETLQLGLQLLGIREGTGRKPPRNPFLRKLTLSAAQSALFNQVLADRLRDGLIRHVLPGDVMAKWPFGGLFRADDIATEQARFNAKEIVTAGPIFGRKTFPSAGVAAEREQAVLQRCGLEPSSFAGFGKLVQGTRRHNLVYVDDLTAQLEGDGIRLRFTLPAGSYATILLRELTKSSHLEATSDEEDRAEQS